MKIYCSGIGGIGLSAYAALQQALGHTVSGSDRTESALLDDLREQGIAITLTQDGSFIPEDCDLFVYSEAIAQNAPERKKAYERKLRSLSYFQALGELSREYTVLAVCGTHGKSSTTAMAARVLLNAGLDPTVVVGTKLRELNGRNWCKGDSNLFLLEACEYRRSFLSLSPTIVLLTNADGDHFDAFASVEEYQDAFRDFLKLVPHHGAIYTHLSDTDCVRVTEDMTHAPVHDVDVLPEVELSVPGEHMRRNAQLVLGLATALHIPEEDIRASLLGYSGSWRRMEVVGTTADDVTVIDDYAHHPREISATIQAMREGYPGRRLVCVFQPHMHDRTLKLYDAFTPCFTGADLLMITDVYDARPDVETQKVSMTTFADDISRQSAVDVLYEGDLAATKERLLHDGLLQSHDILLCLGAGNITDMAREIGVAVQ